MGNLCVISNADLWSQLENSDGRNCPAYEGCQKRLSGEWCTFDKNILLSKLALLTDFNCANHLDLKQGQCGGPFESIKTLTENILIEKGIDRPPIPNEIIHQIFSEDELSIEYLPLRLFHGAVWCLKNRIVIFLNANDTPEINRFSLFHELFHALTYKYTSRRRNINPALTGILFELLAGYFAASLLTPRRMVEESWNRTQNEIVLANEFQVPLPVMSVRLRRLGLIV